MTGLVFDIQRYAVHDGPGIRTLVFLKGCPLRCPWCCNPESQKFRPQLKRSALRCRACGSCADACPDGRNPAAEPFGGEACETCTAWNCAAACPQVALARVGAEWTSAGVVAEVAKDRAFYENSGGGVTLSGGEPLAQPEFALEILMGCKEEGIRTALETCGFATPEVVGEVETLVDLFLFDLKLADPGRHLELLGAPLAPIVQNLRFLASRRPSDIVVRVPVVPGYTDGEENLRGLAELVVTLGLRRVELEPYHSLGEEKYRELGREVDPALRGAAVSGDRLDDALSIFRGRGLSCTVEGF
jgi:pyruvate formate lyase activating enzyme